MNSLLMAAGLSSCLGYAQWTGYYYKLMHRSNVRIPTSWMVDGRPRHEAIIEHAAEYPEDMTRALVELYAEDYCEEVTD